MLARNQIRTLYRLNIYIDIQLSHNNPEKKSFIWSCKFRQGLLEGDQKVNMILNNTYCVKLAKPILKVLFLHASFNDTFVILGLVNQKKDAVFHIDTKGKFLYQFQFQHPMLAMGMLSDKEAIFVQTRHNRISILDLQNHTWEYFPHLFLFEESDQIDIYTFSETKYLCIEQKGRYNDHRYKLTYYKYPLQSTPKGTRSFAIYESKQNQWTYEYVQKKANQRSMIMWYKPRHDISFQFKTYEVKNEKGQYRLYKFSNPLAGQSKFGTVKIETLVFGSWEIKPDSFIFLCWVNKESDKKGGLLNTNYVIEIANNGLIRDAKMTFGPYQDLLIDCYNLGSFSMFRTFRFQNGHSLKTPIYYINNFTQTIIAEQVWECSHLYKYEFQGYSSNLMCEGIYQNENCHEFTVNLKRIVDSNSIYSFLINQGNIELDERLKNDVLFVLE